MRLHLSTWPEVEAYLKARDHIVVPIGSTEQHGPTGLIGTDALTAEMVAEGVGEAAGALVGPTINVGMAVHHTRFPGTITLRPSTLIAYVQDYVNTLAGHGFRRFFFVNGHGGNVASVTAAFYEIYAGRTALGGPGSGDNRSGDNRPGDNRPGDNAAEPRCVLANWWECEEVKALSKELFGASEGSHATPSEVAMTWYKYPGHVKSARLDPPVAPAGRFFGAADYRRRFPDGRIGSDPSLATPENGKRVYDAAVAGMLKSFQAFVAAA